MNDEWKLPKHDRTMVRQRKNQLRKKIEDLRLTIIRDQDRLDRMKSQKEQAEFELITLERNYPNDET